HGRGVARRGGGAGAGRNGPAGELVAGELGGLVEGAAADRRAAVRDGEDTHGATLANEVRHIPETKSARTGTVPVCTETVPIAPHLPCRTCPDAQRSPVRGSSESATSGFWQFPDRMLSFVRTVGLAQRTQAQINITWQGSSFAFAMANMPRFA